MKALKRIYSWPLVICYALALGVFAPWWVCLIVAGILGAGGFVQIKREGGK